MVTDNAASAVLIVDDDPVTGDIISNVLSRDGNNCVHASSGAQAFVLAQQQMFDLMLVDYALPDTDGLRLLKALREQGQEAPAIVITAHPSVRGALEALRSQASDYLSTPFRTAEPLQTVQRIQHDPESVGNDYLWRSLSGRNVDSHMMSCNPRVRMAYLTAAFASKTRAPVLITGETGTGKEYLARAVHRLSDRADAPFVTLNCGALPEELLESELFGHEKGAFTSAVTAKAGLCEAADGGTLFLDEIGDMGRQMQIKLLRFLQDGSYRRLGSTQERQVNVRIVAATNQDLNLRMREGNFREDLFWRINVVGLYLPPLRQRPEDVEPFSRCFLSRFAKELDNPELEMTPKTLEDLQSFMWPGNIRQLHNVLYRTAMLAWDGTIRPEQLALDDYGRLFSSPQQALVLL